MYVCNEDALKNVQKKKKGEKKERLLQNIGQTAFLTVLFQDSQTYRSRPMCWSAASVICGTWCQRASASLGSYGAGVSLCVGSQCCETSRVFNYASRLSTTFSPTRKTFCTRLIPIQPARNLLLHCNVIANQPLAPSPNCYCELNDDVELHVLGCRLTY